MRRVDILKYTAAACAEKIKFKTAPLVFKVIGGVTGKINLF